MNIMNTPTPFKGYAALSRAEPLLSFAYSPGPLGAEQVEIAVNYCGVCPADMSMIKDAWGFSAFSLGAGPRRRSGRQRGTLATILDFCVLHSVAPITEMFPLAGERRAGSSTLR
jgi:hypothetical protein